MIRYSRTIAAAFAAATMAVSLPAMAQDGMSGNLGAYEKLTEVGKAGFRSYLAGAENRAFAIGPGGSWGFTTGEDSQDAAEAIALSRCKDVGGAPCELFAVDKSVMVPVEGWGMASDVDLGTSEIDPVAELAKPGHEAYLTYSKAGGHKAFAVGSGGAWGWAAEETAEIEARQEAISNCEQHGDNCYVYSIDGNRLLDDKK